MISFKVLRKTGTNDGEFVCFSNWTWAAPLRNQLSDSSATLENLHELE